jgi:hypothetical protein
VIGELISSEEAYVTALTAITGIYMAPLAEVLSESELREAFLGIGSICDRHKALLRMLKERPVTEESYPVGGLISSILPILPLYSTYLDNFKKAGTVLQSLSSKPAKVLSGLSHTPDTLMGLEALEIVRVAPVQRLPRYVLLLREVNKKTHVNHPDYKVTLNVVRQLETMLSK